ncbi:MAG TPA: PAS domain S-box protein, partial [Clostridiales bacterium]|nr:PAS domain S-box protein [Clostridiales bacterium]
MESVFQQAPIGITISHNSEFSDVMGDNWIHINAEFERICGRKSEELLKQGWAKITHPDDVEEDLRQFKKLQAGEIKSYSMDKRYIKPDGSVVWVNIIVSALDIKNENQYNHICLVKDITEQKKMFSQIEFDQTAFRTFIDSSQDFIFLKDENFNHIFLNEKLADYFKVKRNEIVGKSDYEFMDIESANQCRISDQKVIDEKKTIISIEKVGDRVFETRKFPVPINENKIWVGAYIRDITSDYYQQEIIDKISETNKIIALCMMKSFADMQEQLDYALLEALKLTGSQYGYIYLYDEEKKEFSLNSWTIGVMADCAVMEKQTKYQLNSTGFWGEVVRQRKPIIVNDFTVPDPLKKGYPKGHVQIKKYMSIPIFENKKIVAVIGFANKETDYTDNDVYAMTVLMSGVWIAVRKREKEKETEMLLERTQAMIENHEAVMYLLEPETGQIIEANNAAEKFFGYSKEELLSMKIWDINILSEKKVRELLLKIFNREKNQFTVPHRLKNGEIRMVDVFSTAIEYRNRRVLFSIAFDVTEREMMTKQNEFLVYHDHLTGIYNRRFFDEEFEKRAEDIEDHYPIGIIWGDMNGFKLYNDSFGHLEGDKALKNIAEKIQKLVRNQDVFARVGGDEFAILVSNTDERAIRAYLNEIEQKVNTSDNNSLTISFGYGIQRKEDDTKDALIKEAEAFMYNRKYYSSKSTRSNAVKVIMETLFAKSEREKQHSDRVGRISEAIAKRMNLDQRTIDKIRVAGFLHDIGKIGIDERILNKIGILTRNEWEVMKLHPAKGAGILENTIEFQDIDDVVLSHHERFDGSGYPSGLKGYEIPQASRIIAVADAYDAMTNDRSYRNKIDHEAALEELKRCAGTFFDPEIVQAFVGMSLPEIMHLEDGESPVS